MAAADDSADWSLVNFAKQVFGAKPAAPETAFNFVEPEPTEDEPASTTAETDEVAAPDKDLPAAEDEIAPVEEPVKTVEPEEMAVESDEMAVAEVQDVSSPGGMQSAISKDGRQSRTASEMADIILNALRADYPAPARGFVVTVYGSRPWNAMLTIKPEAGRIKDARLWRERVQDIGAQLRRDFDIIHEIEEPEPEPDTEPEPEPDTDTDTEPEPEPDADADTEKKTDTETQGDAV
jgi:hypothetical protein